MIVVLITLRMVSQEAAQEWCRIFSQSIERTQEPGWLGGRCVRNTGNPLDVVVIEEWGSRAAFDAWYKSPAWTPTWA